MIPKRVIKLLRAAVNLMEAGLYKEAMQIIHHAYELLHKMDPKE